MDFWQLKARPDKEDADDSDGGLPSSGLRLCILLGNPGGFPESVTGAKEKETQAIDPEPPQRTQSNDTYVMRRSVGPSRRLQTYPCTHLQVSAS